MSRCLFYKAISFVLIFITFFYPSMLQAKPNRCKIIETQYNAECLHPPQRLGDVVTSPSVLISKALTADSSTAVGRALAELSNVSVHMGVLPLRRMEILPIYSGGNLYLFIHEPDEEFLDILRSRIPLERVDSFSQFRSISCYRVCVDELSEHNPEDELRARESCLQEEDPTERIIKAIDYFICLIKLYSISDEDRDTEKVKSKILTWWQIFSLAAIFVLFMISPALASPPSGGDSVEEDTPADVEYGPPNVFEEHAYTVNLNLDSLHGELPDYILGRPFPEFVKLQCRALQYLIETRDYQKALAMIGPENADILDLVNRQISQGSIPWRDDRLDLGIIFTTRLRSGPNNDGLEEYGDQTNFDVGDISLRYVSRGGQIFRMRLGKILGSSEIQANGYYTVLGSDMIFGSGYRTGSGVYYLRPSFILYGQWGEPSGTLNAFRTNFGVASFPVRIGGSVTDLYTDVNLDIGQFGDSPWDTYLYHTTGLRRQRRLSPNWRAIAAVGWPGDFSGSSRWSQSFVPSMLGARLMYSDLLRFDATLDLPLPTIGHNGIERQGGSIMQVSSGLRIPRGLVALGFYGHSMQAGGLDVARAKPWAYTQWQMVRGLGVYGYTHYDRSSTGLHPGERTLFGVDMRDGRPSIAGFEAQVGIAGTIDELLFGGRPPVTSDMDTSLVVGYDFDVQNTPFVLEPRPSMLHPSTMVQTWPRQDGRLIGSNREITGTLQIGGKEFSLRIHETDATRFTFTDNRTGDVYTYVTPHLPAAVTYLLREVNMFPAQDVYLADDAGRRHAQLSLASADAVHRKTGVPSPTSPSDRLHMALQWLESPLLSSDLDTEIWADALVPSDLLNCGRLDDLKARIAGIDSQIRRFYESSDHGGVPFEELDGFEKEFVIEMGGKYYKVHLTYKHGKIIMIDVEETDGPARTGIGGEDTDSEDWALDVSGRVRERLDEEFRRIDADRRKGIKYMSAPDEGV